MKKFLNKLSPTHELLIVLIIVFGWLIYASNIQFVRNFIASDSPDIVNYYYNNLSYFHLLIFELAIIGLIALFLEARNWRTQDFPMKLNFKIIGAGFLLLFSINIILNLTSLLPFVQEYLSSKSTSLQNAPNTSFALAILATVIVNPFFEEIFLIGYLGKWSDKFSPVFFVVISTLIRVSYHTYQGYFGMYSVMIIGLIFTLYYLKYKNLTPIILAHMLFNLNYFIRLFYFNEPSP